MCVSGSCVLSAALLAYLPLWPVARHFDEGHVSRVALPMGGIGCGAVSLSGRGELCDWEIMNVPNKGSNGFERQADSRTFFAIRVRGKDRTRCAMLAGRLEPWEYFNANGQPAPQSGLPRFSSASFDAAFPFGVVHLADTEMPVRVDIRGFSPFVPGDSAASSLPVASLEYVVENLTDEAIDISIGAFVRNFVGNDGRPVGWAWNGFSKSEGEKDNWTRYREGKGLRGLLCGSAGVSQDSPAWGTFALCTSDADAELSHRETFDVSKWNRTALDFWDDFADDGRLSSDRSGTPHGGLSVSKRVPSRGKVSFRFFFTWNFPNRKAWADSIVGNWYSGHYRDAWDAAEQIVPRLPELERRSLDFTRRILEEDAPAVIKEAALSSLAVLKSQTVFRVPTGELLGWEGVFDHVGSCKGSCTHVWNYENAVAALFPDLARSMREVEFGYATDPDSGAMDFRVELPLGGRRNGEVAADGQMGCIMKVRRDWLLAKNEPGFDADGWLRKLWPNVRQALAYAWRPDGWDADQDGLMEGRQHNTMDVDYFGPNPQMAFWYLGALRSAAEMADVMGDAAFAEKCRALFERGSKGVDEKLFNGDYYEQLVPVGKETAPYQLGRGCLVDQLVGQQMAHLWDLGDLADPSHLRKACESIMRWNWIPSFSRHFNNMRVYALGDESGLLMASWPKGRRDVPFPYFGEVMTGFEYVAAAEMIFQGMDAEAEKVVRAIRDRHDGLKRNPFSEPECGHNYARSMAAWNCLLAWRKKHPRQTVDPYGYKDLVETVQCPLSARERPDGSRLFDFGKDAVGWLELRDVPSGAYEIVAGEMTNACGHVTNAYPQSTIHTHLYAGTVSGPSWRMPFPVDQLNTTGWDPKAPAILIPDRFGRIAPFRFVEVVKSPAGVRSSDIVRHAVHYPIDMTQSAFESEDRILNAVYEMCRYSVWATSFCGVYVDGDRERTPYEADAYINQLCHYAIDADCSLARKSHEWLMEHPTWPTEWKQHSIKMAWADWMWTGDTRSLAKYYGRLKTEKLYAGFSAREDGLLVTTPGTDADPHDIVDYPPVERDGFVMTTVNAVVNAFHYRNLQEMADIARAIGRTDDARAFERQAETVRASYLKAFRDPEDKLYCDGEGCAHKSLHASAIALAFGLVPQDEVAVVADFIERKGMACSVYFAHYYLEALYAAGRDAAAMKLMTATGDRSWWGMIEFGSTVSMEAWNMAVKPNQDLNHMWGAVPLNMIARRVLGVTPLEPGFAKVQIRPQTGGLRRVRGRVPTVKGPVTVEIDGEHLHVGVPAAARVEWRGKTWSVEAGQHDF